MSVSKQEILQLEEQILNLKKKISKYDYETRKRLEDEYVAEILYHSEAMEEETLPKEEFIQEVIKLRRDVPLTIFK